MEVLADGTRIEKCHSEESDGHRDGAKGRIISRLGPVGHYLGYFVEWDDLPGTPCFVSHMRVRAAAKARPT